MAFSNTDSLGGMNLPKMMKRLAPWNEKRYKYEKNVVVPLEKLQAKGCIKVLMFGPSIMRNLRVKYKKEVWDKYLLHINAFNCGVGVITSRM